MQSETRDEDDISTAFCDFCAAPMAKAVSGLSIAEASVSAARAEAEAEASKTPAAARFGGRALPGMPGMSPGGGFRLPGMGNK